MNNPRNHSDLCHAWAHQSIVKRVGNIIADDDVIYSYGYHFAMARKITKWRNVEPDQRINFLFTTKSYSTSTSKHLCYLSRALHGTVISVDNVKAHGPRTHTENLVAMMEDFFDLLGKCQRARTYARMHADSAIQRRADFFKYQRNFLKRGFVSYLNKEQKKMWHDFRNMTDTELRQIRDDAVDRSAEANAYMSERKQQTWQEILGRWRANKRRTLPRHVGIHLRLTKDKTMIQTSAGVVFSLPIAMMLYRRVLRAVPEPTEALEVREIESPFGAGPMNGSLKIGQEVKVHNFGYGDHMTVYQDRSVKMGCHDVPWIEIDMMAEQLGWKSAPAIEMNINA